MALDSWRLDGTARAVPRLAPEWEVRTGEWGKDDQQPSRQAAPAASASLRGICTGHSYQYDVLLPLQ